LPHLHGTACYIKGAGALLNEAQAALGISSGETPLTPRLPDDRAMHRLLQRRSRGGF